MCVYYMTGTPEGSTESGFMEKPGIEPATPGLQGISLILYTTGASLIGLVMVCIASAEKNSYSVTSMKTGLKNKEDLFDYVDICVCPQNVLSFTYPLTSCL